MLESEGLTLNSHSGSLGKNVYFGCKLCKLWVLYTFCISFSRPVYHTLNTGVPPKFLHWYLFPQYDGFRCEAFRNLHLQCPFKKRLQSTLLPLLPQKDKERRQPGRFWPDTKSASVLILNFNCEKQISVVKPSRPQLFCYRSINRLGHLCED